MLFGQCNSYSPTLSKIVLFLSIYPRHGDGPVTVSGMRDMTWIPALQHFFKDQAFLDTAGVFVTSDTFRPQLHGSGQVFDRRNFLSVCMVDIKPLPRLPKESPLTSYTQLRPISLTAVIMRLFERLVYRFELSSICNGYIDLDQFSYREGHNSTMALIKCQHTWLKWLDGNADFVRIFSFDFSKPSTLYHTISSVVNWSKLTLIHILLIGLLAF